MKKRTQDPNNISIIDQTADDDNYADTALGHAIKQYAGMNVSSSPMLHMDNAYGARTGAKISSKDRLMRSRQEGNFFNSKLSGWASSKSPVDTKSMHSRTLSDERNLLP